MMNDAGVDQDQEEMSDDEFDGYFDEDIGKGDEDDTEIGHQDNMELHHQDPSMSAADLHIGSECDVAGPGYDLPLYSLSPGCNPSRLNATPLELFKMLLTDSILDKIVEQTNLYATQYISSHTLPPRSRVHSWTKEPFTRDELHKFLSLIIVMGLVNLPTLEDHWSTTWPYSSVACSKVSYKIYTSVIQECNKPIYTHNTYYTYIICTYIVHSLSLWFFSKIGKK